MLRRRPGKWFSVISGEGDSKAGETCLLEGGPADQSLFKGQFEGKLGRVYCVHYALAVSRLFSCMLAGQAPRSICQPAGPATGPGGCPGLQRVVGRCLQLTLTSVSSWLSLVCSFGMNTANAQQAATLDLAQHPLDSEVP